MHGAPSTNCSAEKIDFDKDFYPAIMKALFQSEAWIAAVMITDLLGRKYRFNVPGTAAYTNWTRRMSRTVAQLRTSASELSQALVKAELQPGDIVIREGAPPQPAPAKAGHFLDRAL